MSIRAGLGALATLVVASGVGLSVGAAPAHADSAVTVRGTALPAGAQLTLVGCGSLFGRTAEQVQPRIGFAPDAPAGERSMGFDLAGGNAVGPAFTVPSVVRTATAAISVQAAQGASGVAYAGYRSPADAGTNLVWFGRAPLTAAAGGWQSVDARKLSYVWTKYDLATGRVVEPAAGRASDVVAFAAAHGGDGPGIFTVGFGCDGRPFRMDALRTGATGGVTTYDIEGLLTATQMHGDHATIKAGESVVLRGALEVTSGGTIPRATLLLEERPAGTDEWVTVGAVDAADAQLTVTPERRTFYRWRFIDRPLAETSTSLPFVVDVVAADGATPPATQPPSPSATQPPSTSPSASPSATPSATPSPKPSASPSATPSPKPSASPSATPSPKPSASPSATPSTKPSASPSATPSAIPAP